MEEIDMAHYINQQALKIDYSNLQNAYIQQKNIQFINKTIKMAMFVDLEIG